MLSWQSSRLTSPLSFSANCLIIYPFLRRAFCRVFEIEKSRRTSDGPVCYLDVLLLVFVELVGTTFCKREPSGRSEVFCLSIASLRVLSSFSKLSVLTFSGLGLLPIRRF